MKDMSAHLNESLSNKRSIKLEMSDSQKKIYHKAIDYISRREHSKKELRIKLSQKYPDSNDIDFIIEQLIELDYLSEERFCDATIRKFIKKGHSNQKIKQLLQSEEILVNDQKINEISAEFGINNEQKINDLISKKMKNFANSSDHTKTLKKKRSVINFLLARGYDYSEIFGAVNKAFKNLLN